MEALDVPCGKTKRERMGKEKFFIALLKDLTRLNEKRKVLHTGDEGQNWK